MPFTTTSNYLHTSYLQHTATRRVTWPTTVSSSPTPVSDNCVLPTLKHLLSVGRAAVWETWTFATAGPQVWNSLPPSLRVCGLSYGPVQTVIEDIFIRTVRPWRSVNCFSLCRTKIILLTYTVDQNSCYGRSWSMCGGSHVMSRAIVWCHCDCSQRGLQRF